MAQKQSTTNRGTIIQINEEQAKDHLGEIVRGTVQETLTLFPFPWRKKVITTLFPLPWRERVRVRGNDKAGLPTSRRFAKGKPDTVVLSYVSSNAFYALRGPRQHRVSSVE